MATHRPWIFLAALACLGACGSDNRGSPLRVGSDSSGGRAGSAGIGGAQPIGGGEAGVAGTGNSRNPLSVQIEDLEDMAIEIVTLSCAGECADVQAVARGGNPPYAFQWNDGSTDPERELCPDETTSFDVTATDTAIEAEEFSYAGASKTARVTANVLECGGDGGTPDAAVLPLPDNCIDLAEPSSETPQWEICSPTTVVDPWTGLPRTCMEHFARLGNYPDRPREEESLGGVLCAGLRAGVSHPIRLALNAVASGDDPLLDSLAGTLYDVELWGGSSSCDQGELLFTVVDVPFVDEGSLCLALTPTRDHSHIHAVLRLKPPLQEYRRSCAAVVFMSATDNCE